MKKINEKKISSDIYLIFICILYYIYIKRKDVLTDNNKYSYITIFSEISVNFCHKQNLILG